MSDERDDSRTARWIFECQGCGERWHDPEAPVTGHYCDWHGRGMPPKDMDEADVIAVKTPGEDDD